MALKMDHTLGKTGATDKQARQAGPGLGSPAKLNPNSKKWPGPMRAGGAAKLTGSAALGVW